VAGLTCWPHEPQRSHGRRGITQPPQLSAPRADLAPDSGNELSRSRPPDLRVLNKGPLMIDDRQWPDDAELQRIIIWKIAHDLSRFYAVETQLAAALADYRRSGSSRASVR
jgi:hypothetical protein